MKRSFGILLVLMLLFSWSTFILAQEKAAPKEEKKSDKMEMTKTEKDMGSLKSATCDPACGFMVRSRSEKEIVSIIKSHAKKMHNMTMTDKQVKDMIKTEESPAAK